MAKLGLASGLLWKKAIRAVVPVCPVACGRQDRQVRDNKNGRSGESLKRRIGNNKVALPPQGGA
ncbi:hypothetical protein [Methylobacterium sp. R2-1]|uniref:hypothetical protein n=1 Tax=Methylobacterium sp. R2-1 TaxID=2587064 RepID=UPI00160F4CB0|nr:hypothetical protein [Methylobacterium sp. R2-1]MBB2964187.1 hypothetical protein [Methylobacterium sp. R2-1]